MANVLLETQKLGQSIWYDNISRSMFASGFLQKMIDEGLLGMTSNPAIFEKAIAGSADYDAQLKEVARSGDAKTVFEQLAISDIQHATDLFKSVYEKTKRKDGYVSLEVSPYLAEDTEGTIAEGRRLYALVKRENVMIKVPATTKSIPAITALIGDGINVNVTLLFALDAYDAASDAYLAGLEKFAAAGGDLSKVASVASFFLSRIDTLVDDKLPKDSPLRGKTAIASAKLAYTHYEKMIASPRWKALAEKGAQPQRLLWASTSAKNPAYSKTLYVDTLIGPDTVNTVPGDTYDAFKASGTAKVTITANVEQARDTIKQVEAAGISMKAVTDQLVKEAVEKFAQPFDKLLGAVEKKRQAFVGEDLDQQELSLGQYTEEVNKLGADWTAQGKLRQMWAKDAAVWTGTDEAKWLGWLDIVREQLAHVSDIEKIGNDTVGFTDAVVLGMGGSSLCPWVLEQTFGDSTGPGANAGKKPRLWVLDSTVPAQVQAIEKSINVDKTLFIVSSKSGSTVEPNALMAYFMEKVPAKDRAKHFIAITDPGSSLEKIAQKEGFRHIASGVPSIGGRYSALSNFGMVPGAIMGLDVRKFLERTQLMVDACSRFSPAEFNPGVALGIALGVLANHGRDKVTFVASPKLHAIGAWLEQLIAESTGKKGKGIVPIAGEALAPVAAYGNDRVFAYLHDGAEDHAQVDALVLLEKAGHPVVRIALADVGALGQEFFRWEIATAVAGAVMGINPFDQPDVEAAKIATRRLIETAAGDASEKPLAESEGLQIFADKGLSGSSVKDVLAAHLKRLGAGDYFAINAYIQMSAENQAQLEALRLTVRDGKRVATTIGFGPRFLHSTGQLHKGGANNGVFLEITGDDTVDMPIPGMRYGFSQLKTAQGLGDYEVLQERQRRVVRVNLKDAKALATLRALVETVVKEGK